MVQPVENDPAAQPAPLPNGEVAPEAPDAPAAAPAPDAAPAPAAIPVVVVPAAPAPAPAAADGPPPLVAARLRRPPAGLPGPRRRPVLPAAQLLCTESRTCELLSGLPAVEHACRRGQRQHQRLLQTNWVYTMVFVYSAFVYRAAMMSRRFGGAFIGTTIDSSMFNLLSYIVFRYPFLRARPEQMRTTTKNYLHDNRRRGVLATLSVTVITVTLRPVSFAFQLHSLFLRAWSWVIERISELLNDGGLRLWGGGYGVQL
ncbi:hypothetical protein FJT64_015546 [Amphibalanus amphitrite]|uniref:Uncharacterized protein n=1 Tax=Amphibalanus amphitrite TaxID=1232801 RepID=A0A6A4X2K8_AMPAM|nr:hypothetical protein FJT64_015546 [Amphibalanus amphitrite]